MQRMFVGWPDLERSDGTPFRELVAMMAALSEEGASAGWCHHIEHILWDLAHHPGPFGWGFVEVTPDLGRRLLVLAVATDGWPANNLHGGLNLVPLQEWRARHAVWRLDNAVVDEAGL